MAFSYPPVYIPISEAFEQACFTLIRFLLPHEACTGVNRRESSAGAPERAFPIEISGLANVLVNTMADAAYVRYDSMSWEVEKRMREAILAGDLPVYVKRADLLPVTDKDESNCELLQIAPQEWEWREVYGVNTGDGSPPGPLGGFSDVDDYGRLRLRRGDFNNWLQGPSSIRTLSGHELSEAIRTCMKEAIAEKNAIGSKAPNGKEQVQATMSVLRARGIKAKDGGLKRHVQQIADEPEFVVFRRPIGVRVS